MCAEAHSRRHWFNFRGQWATWNRSLLQGCWYLVLTSGALDSVPPLSTDGTDFKCHCAFVLTGTARICQFVRGKMWWNVANIFEMALSQVNIKPDAMLFFFLFILFIGAYKGIYIFCNQPVVCTSGHDSWITARSANETVRIQIFDRLMFSHNILRVSAPSLINLSCFNCF